MKRTFKKLDSLIFAAVSGIVVGWVKRKKFAKHKYDFFLMIHDWEIAWWCFVICYIAYKGAIVHHQIFLAVGVSAFLILLVGAGVVGKRYLLNSQKADYDLIFARRKNPQIYNLVKEFNALIFENSYKQRVFMLVFNIAVLFYFIFELSPVAPIFILNTMWLYDRYIFDFDEPDKKDEKKKEPLTELLAGRWRQITAGLAPKGA